MVSKKPLLKRRRFEGDVGLRRYVLNPALSLEDVLVSDDRCDELAPPCGCKMRLMCCERDGVSRGRFDLRCCDALVPVSSRLPPEEGGQTRLIVKNDLRNDPAGREGQ